MSVCPSVTFQSVTTYSLNHALTYFTPNERARQLLFIDVFTFLIQILKKALFLRKNLLREFHLYSTHETIDLSKG